MPSWLQLLLAVVALVLWVGIEAALTMGDRRAFGIAVKHFGGAALAIAALCAVVVGVRFMFFASP